MKKRWRAITGMILAGCLLAGCGSQPQNRGEVQPPAPDTEAVLNGADALGENEGYARAQQLNPMGGEGDNGEDNHEEEQGMTEEAIREFSYKLAKEALEYPDRENPVIAPISAYFALSMAATGACGETAAELENLLGENHKQLSESSMALLQGRMGVELELANSAWLDQRFQAKEQWLEAVQESYKGEVYCGELDSRQIMEDINAWAGEHTHGLVERFLAQPLQEGTRLSLLNALYLKADWLDCFEGYATHRETWHREDGTEKQVDTMHNGQVHFDYVADADMDGVMLPFQGEELVFLALRPRAGQTVRELCGQLTPRQLARLLEGREQRLMNLSLPRFTVSCDQQLEELLQNLGVRRAFDPLQADFSGLGADAEGQPLYISLVRQKAVIELNEEGVEAGAVTIVVVRAGGAPSQEEPLEMYLDHPFVYMILDLETQVPLFVGIMDDPG